MRRVAAAGLLAVEEGLRLWHSDIWDPPATYHAPEPDRWRAAIDEMICGDDGLGWSWKHNEWGGPYPGDGDFEWCGAFVATCWSVAGLPLAARLTFFASTERLRTWGSYHRWDEHHLNARPDAGPWRMIARLDEHSTTVVMSDGSPPQPGDVLLVGGVNTGPGKHIALVESYDPLHREFRTIEGNARGIGPDAKKRQGVVRWRRPLGLPLGMMETTYHARWLIRPAPSDLE